MSRSREHLSIGEVLTLIQQDFPDVTISKIRFLESQGLLSPERTPSGYRKFREADLEQLRWVLRQQKERFLPLKVIRESLARGEHLRPEPEPEPQSVADQTTRSGPSAEGDRAVPSGSAAPDAASADVGDGIGGLEDVGPTSLALSVEELLAATGLSPEDLQSLESYGLIESRSIGPATYYDGEALIVAKLAAGFAVFGVEARHLRMYKVAAQREASVFEQVIMPLVRQRNPSSARKAREQLEEMARMGARMRGAMIRLALRDHLEP
ncbi:MAG TPA: MerR family DNA-binding transcriptional regulator [Acidimicrobiales bacterium]|nr:MerR family DNA-binding transcriptional regulator [Acidimicrobiales bacterium]